MNTIFQTVHVQLALKSRYEQFSHQLEQTLNSLEMNWADQLLTNPDAVRFHAEQLQGDAGLMIFGKQESGGLLNLDGTPKRAAQYLIGNPLVALSMVRHDFRAALYAPIRVLFYEDETNQLYAEYDLPSSQFGQFGNEEIRAIAEKLDKKLEDVILKADNISL
jgi:uncharacterized protein (DUF302 family)